MPPDQQAVRPGWPGLNYSPVKESPATYVAICDWDPHWWGEFTCFKYQRNRVEWTAECDEQPAEQSIHDIRSFRLKGWEHSIIEVFGCTHMGNGDLYLYELDGRSLRLVLKTRAVDFHCDDAVFHGGKLSPEYRDLNGDGMPDVRLTGRIDHLQEMKSEILRSEDYARTFLWSPTRHRFTPVEIEVGQEE